MAQQVKNPNSIHEDVGSIPGLDQWVKNSVLLQSWEKEKEKKREKSPKKKKKKFVSLTKWFCSHFRAGNGFSISLSFQTSLHPQKITCTVQKCPQLSDHFRNMWSL